MESNCKHLLLQVTVCWNVLWTLNVTGISTVHQKACAFRDVQKDKMTVVTTSTVSTGNANVTATKTRTASRTMSAQTVYAWLPVSLVRSFVGSLTSILITLYY